MTLKYQRHNGYAKLAHFIVDEDPEHCGVDCIGNLNIALVLG
jgi:hypothetical protein